MGVHQKQDASLGSLALGAAFAQVGEIDVFERIVGGLAWGMKRARIALACDYTGGTANTGRAELEVRWGYQGTATRWRPASGGTILLLVADGSGESDSLVAIENPGGLEVLEVNAREVGDVGSPGNLAITWSAEFES